MLIEFKVENFKSIREEQTFSFVGSNYSDELPDNYHVPDLPGMAGVRLLKMAAIYGANASGKSNVIHALCFLADFVANSFGIKAEAPTGVTPFLFEKEWAERPTLFEITFLAEGVRYTYGLGLTPERVTEEYLVAFPNGRAVPWFERTWNAEMAQYVWSKPNEPFHYEEAVKAATRANCSFLSTGPQFNHPQLTSIQKWFEEKFYSCTLEDRLTPRQTARSLHGAPPAFKEAVLLFLRTADLGILDVTVEKVIRTQPLLRSSPFETSREFEVKFRHKSRNPDAWLSLADESHGTQRLFALAYPYLAALFLGNLVCFDEIEASLHPFLARELVKMFSNPVLNAKNAQLIFTTHNPVLLDQELLRRDQFWFTEKDETGATHLYPLLNYSPRKGEALMKGYLAGRYGAVPFIPEGLVKP